MMSIHARGSVISQQKNSVEFVGQTPPLGTWLNVVSHLDPKYGGLSTVVPQLCSSVAALGNLHVNLAVFCLPNERYEPPDLELGITYWPTSRFAWLRRRNLTTTFRETIHQADGVHIHGLWEQSTVVAARAARSTRTPYLLSSHGMLEPWALANKHWKKRIYARVFEHANVAGASCLHALTQSEAKNYRHFGGRAPIAVIPNGVAIPESIDPEIFLTQFPLLRGKRIILFLGRIHFKKGLDLLVRSWATLARKWPEAHLVLAGPDSENTRVAVEQLIAESGIGEQVLFTGMLRGTLKWSALAAAQCFVLPSYSEGLSTSVLEAMGIGLPVIVTTACNIPEVKTHQCGWEIQSDTQDLALTLSEFLRNSLSTNKAIGARGKLLVRKQYEWKAIALRMDEVYQWVSGGPRPSLVDVQLE